LTLLVIKGIMVLGPLKLKGTEKVPKKCYKCLKEKLFRLLGTWSPLFSLKGRLRMKRVNDVSSARLISSYSSLGTEISGTYRTVR